MLNRVLAVLLVVAVLTGAACACPACKESVPSSNADSPGSVAEGVNASIYLMLGAFLTVLGFILNLVVKAARPAPRGFPVRRERNS